MAVKKKDELLNALKELLADNDSDTALEFLGDFTDTMNAHEQEDIDKEDWKAKYDENDAAWRKKYKERFFSMEPVGGEDKKPSRPEGTPMTVSDLFKETD